MELKEAREWAKLILADHEKDPNVLRHSAIDTALTILDDRITELEGQLKIKHGLLEDCQKWMDYHNDRADKAEAERDELVGALHNLLQSQSAKGEVFFKALKAAMAIDTKYNAVVDGTNG